MYQSVLSASLAVKAAGSFCQWVFSRRFLACSELGANEPFSFLWKFTFTIFSSQPNYLLCSSDMETRAEHVGPGDVILGHTEGQHGLHFLEANMGSGSCKLPWGPSPFNLTGVSENITVLRYPSPLCWRLLLLQQSQQRESRPVPWLLHPVLNLHLTWRRVCTRMLNWKIDCLQCGHGSNSSRGASQNSGQRCLKTLKLDMGQSPGMCWVKPFFKSSVLS